MNENLIQEARKILGNFIKQARKERNISQKEVAELVNVNVMTISKIENGKFNFGIDIFNKLSIVLGFKMELIMKDIEDIKGRFDLIESLNFCTVIDKSTGIRITFEKGAFNTTQKIEMPSGISLSVSDLATTMRMIGEWLNDNHNSII